MAIAEVGAIDPVEILIEPVEDDPFEESFIEVRRRTVLRSSGCDVDRGSQPVQQDARQRVGRKKYLS